MCEKRKYLQLCLDADKWALGIKRRYPRLCGDEVWKYERALRWCEYLRNIGHKWSLASIFWTLRFRRLGFKLGFSISVNCIGPGLRINHHGLLVINSRAKIGKWCDIHQGVNIGTNSHRINGTWIAAVPSIGNFCFIGPGAKIFDDIQIGNNVRVGANAVINKSVDDDMVVYGIPATQHPNKGEQLTIACQSVEDAFLKAYPQYQGML